jgi:hypothetical protein
VAQAVANAEFPDGPLAVISAGWQETEGDIDELRDVLGRPLEDLRLYRREEELLTANTDLATGARLRQERLIEQQRLYRLRLKHLSNAARQVLRADGDSELVAAEQRHAIAQLRALDRHHLYRTELIWRRFSAEYGADTQPELARHALEIGDIVNRCSGIVLTGGNVAVLINRLRLFGVDRLLEHSNIVAWSAGAMVLADRIILFHDHAPEGRRDAEILGAGCNAISGFVFLPDARRRLKRADRRRVGLFSRRFAPDVCVALDAGNELQLSGSTIVRVSNARKLCNNGRVAALRPK